MTVWLSLGKRLECIIFNLRIFSILHLCLIAKNGICISFLFNKLHERIDVDICKTTQLDLIVLVKFKGVISSNDKSEVLYLTILYWYEIMWTIYHIYAAMGGIIYNKNMKIIQRCCGLKYKGGLDIVDHFGRVVGTHVIWIVYCGLKSIYAMFHHNHYRAIYDICLY